MSTDTRKEPNGNGTCSDDPPARWIGNIALSHTSRLRAAFFDLDGTIVDASNHVTPGSLQAISRLREHGVAVGVATGRPLFGAKNIIAQLPLTAPSMFFSGALIVQPQTNDVIFCQQLDQALVLKLVKECARWGLYCELYSDQGYYVERLTALSYAHEHYLGILPQTGSLLSLVENIAVLKIVIATDNPEDERKLRTLAAELNGPPLIFSTGAAHPEVLFANLTHPDASRENAFNLILASLGLESQQVASFGDAEADIPFLQRAGFGVAMGNAPARVKQAASYVTSSLDDEGTAYALECLRPYWERACS